MRDEVAITGGVSKNIGVVRAMEKKLGLDIRIIDSKTCLGALGFMVLEGKKVEVYNDMGHQEKARAALNFAQNFAATGEQAAWSRAMLAHDLRNPLSGILATMELLELKSPDRPVRQMAQTVLHAVQFMLELIGDMLDLARSRTNKPARANPNWPVTAMRSPGCASRRSGT